MTDMFEPVACRPPRVWLGPKLVMKPPAPTSFRETEMTSTRIITGFGPFPGAPRIV